MKTLFHFRDFVKEISANNSRKYKQEVLRKYDNDVIILTYLQFAFNPYTTFGISTKKLYKKVGGHQITGIESVFGLLEYLKEHNTGTDQVISLCQEILSCIGASDVESADLLEKLICKDLSIGCDAKTINSIIPGLIPTFEVQLAQKYFEKPEKLEGKSFAVTTKIDGGRIIAIKDNGKVEFYTRAGQRYEGLVDLEEEMLRTFPDGTVLDGEITILDDKGIPSKEAYKKAMKITRSDGEKHGLKMKCFDAMYIDEWRAQTCTHDYIERRMLLKGLYGSERNHKYFEVIPELYRGDDTSKILELLDEAIANKDKAEYINVDCMQFDFDLIDYFDQNLKEIASNAFQNCATLKEFIIRDNPNFISENNKLYVNGKKIEEEVLVGISDNNFNIDGVDLLLHKKIIKEI